MTCQNSPANARVLPSRRDRLIRLRKNRRARHQSHPRAPGTGAARRTIGPLGAGPFPAGRRRPLTGFCNSSALRLTCRTGDRFHRPWSPPDALQSPPLLGPRHPLPGLERARDNAGGHPRSPHVAGDLPLDLRAIQDVVAVMADELKWSNADRDKALSHTVAILMEKRGQSTKRLVERVSE